MQLSETHKLVSRFIEIVRKEFGNSIDCFCIENVIDDPCERHFEVLFNAYNYFWIRMVYDRGRFGWSIDMDQYRIPLKSSQVLYEEADFGVFFKEMREEIESRIPDKYLEYREWERGWQMIPYKTREKRRRADRRRSRRKISTASYGSKEESRIQLNRQAGMDELASCFCDMIKAYFGNRVDTFTIEDVIDDGRWNAFTIRFRAYNFFNMKMVYDRGSFGWSICQGQFNIGIRSSQEWFDKADFDIFFKEMREGIENRIPDEFLKKHGWYYIDT